MLNSEFINENKFTTILIKRKNLSNRLLHEYIIAFKFTVLTVFYLFTLMSGILWQRMKIMHFYLYHMILFSWNSPLSAYCLFLIIISQLILYLILLNNLSLINHFMQEKQLHFIFYRLLSVPFDPGFLYIMPLSNRFARLRA